MTNEKWFASGESNVFRLGTDFKSVPKRQAEKIFETRALSIFQRSRIMSRLKLRKLKPATTL
jgi:hypothetical protein